MQPELVPVAKRHRRNTVNLILPQQTDCVPDHLDCTWWKAQSSCWLTNSLLVLCWSLSLWAPGLPPVTYLRKWALTALFSWEEFNTHPDKDRATRNSVKGHLCQPQLHHIWTYGCPTLCQAPGYYRYRTNVAICCVHWDDEMCWTWSWVRWQGEGKLYLTDRNVTVRSLSGWFSTPIYKSELATTQKWEGHGILMKVTWSWESPTKQG